MLTGTKFQTRTIVAWLTHKVITTGHAPSPTCISQTFGISRASGFRYNRWARDQIKPTLTDEVIMQSQSAVIEHANRPSAVESSDFESTATPCLCGAQPLITYSGGTHYMSCPPCWVRGHRFESAALAIAQWNAMIHCARKPS